MNNAHIPLPKDRFPWTILIIVFLLQSVIGAAFTFFQRRDDINHTEENLAANLHLLETILHTNLQNAQYQEIEPLLTNWVRLNEDKVDHLDLTAINGFVFFQHDQEEHPGNFFSRSVPIAYSYTGSATLTIHWCLVPADLHARNTLMILGLILLITTLSLAYGLRLATLRKKDARMLADRARELHREKEQLQVTLRSLGEGVFSIDHTGTILLANQAAEEMIDCHGKLCLGQSIDEVLDLVEGDSETRFMVLASGVLQEAEEGPKELTLRTGRQEPRFVSLSCSPITSRQNETTGWVVVLRDISQTKRLEQEQRKNSMLEALGVLAGGIAHDFNNILMAISGNLNLAQEMSSGDAELEEILSSADKATGRAADLTRQLLTFAKGGSPILDANAIDEVVREAADFVTHGADLNIRYHFDPDLLPVLIDKHQIGQVMQNLVINARQAMPTGGLLTISCTNTMERQGDQERPLVRIEITDQGSGIPETEVEHIFDPYYTTKMEGSGLGLAVVYSIVTRHQGRIEVSSRQGEGTTFTIHLPASRQEVAAGASSDKPLTRRTGRVLVMDDDKAVRLITCRMVRQLGFEVVEADRGDRAIEIYKDHLQRGETIDLVIMDLTVPRGMGGQEAIRVLLGIDPECRAVVASGYSHDPVMADHRDYGFSAALVKPFNLRQLSQALGKVLDQS